PGCAPAAPPAPGRPRGAAYSPRHRGQRQQLPTSRADLNLSVHTRAHPTGEARCPAAIALLDLGQRRLPVLPQPVLVEPGVEVVPWQHLRLPALPSRVPIQVHAVGRQHLRGGVHPTLEGEILTPTVEPATGLPHPPDHRTHPTVT